MLWDITTKFLPVKDLIRSQLFTKFDGYSLKNGAATPLTIWNFSRAWQAYFWSYTLQILCENTTFIDVQMICSDDFDISSGFRFEKIWLSCTVHTYSLYLLYSSHFICCLGKKVWIQNWWKTSQAFYWYPKHTSVMSLMRPSNLKKSQKVGKTAKSDFWRFCSH